MSLSFLVDLACGSSPTTSAASVKPDYKELRKLFGVSAEAAALPSSSSFPPQSLIPGSVGAGGAGVAGLAFDNNNSEDRVPPVPQSLLSFDAFAQRKENSEQQEHLGGDSEEQPAIGNQPGEYIVTAADLPDFVTLRGIWNKFFREKGLLGEEDGREEAGKKNDVA